MIDTDLQVVETTPDLVVRFLLTSTDNQNKVVAVKAIMEPNIKEPKGRKKQAVPYPLRFRSHAERKRIYDAAARMRQSVRDFILQATNQRAMSVLENGVDLRAS